MIRASRRTPSDAPSDDVGLAALARSIVSCPGSVDLTVMGAPDVLAGEPPLGMDDVDGAPAFSCRPGSGLAQAAAQGRHAVVRLTSGLGRAGDPERGDRLALGGRLVLGEVEDCACCARPEVRACEPRREEVRQVVWLRLDDVVLQRAQDGSGPQPLSTRAYSAPHHRLNRGYLHRSAAHASECHGEQLRVVAAHWSGTAPDDLLGAVVTDLTPRGLTLVWVDVEGAHTAPLTFSRPATDPDDLGRMLREELRTGRC